MISCAGALVRLRPQHHHWPGHELSDQDHPMSSATTKRQTTEDGNIEPFPDIQPREIT
jgi:hypothetical protein